MITILIFGVAHFMTFQSAVGEDYYNDDLRSYSSDYGGDTSNNNYDSPKISDKKYLCQDGPSEGFL